MAVRSSNSKDPARIPAKSFEWPPEGGGQLPKATAPLNLATIWENSVGRDRPGNREGSENRRLLHLTFAVNINMGLKEKERSPVRS